MNKILITAATILLLFSINSFATPEKYIIKLSENKSITVKPVESNNENSIITEYICNIPSGLNILNGYCKDNVLTITKPLGEDIIGSCDNNTYNIVIGIKTNIGVCLN